MGELFVSSVFVGALLLLFPVFLYADSYVDITENRAWFSIALYRFLRVFGGYGQLDREGIAVHLTKKKAVFVPYREMTATRKKFEVTKGFQLYVFHQIVETGGAERVYGVMLAALLQAAGGAACSVLQTQHPFLSLRNSTVLNDEPCLKITTRSVLVFNGLVLIIAFAKKITEAFLKWIRDKKSTTFSKRQPNS